MPDYRAMYIALLDVHERAMNTLACLLSDLAKAGKQAESIYVHGDEPELIVVTPAKGQACKNTGADQANRDRVDE